MKKLSILGLLTILIAGPFFTAAQTASEHPPKVEILPAAPGFLKILYVNEDEHKVKVNIIGSEGLLHTDRIFLDEGSKGFTRKYNLSEMNPGIYFVEVSNKSMTVKYQFDLLDDKKVFAKYWQWTETAPSIPASIVASSKPND